MAVAEAFGVAARGVVIPSRGGGRLFLVVAVGEKIAHVDQVHPGEAFLRLRESKRMARYEEEPQITQITGITQMFSVRFRRKNRRSDTERQAIRPDLVRIVPKVA